MVDFFPKGVAWINKEYVDISEARLPILDWGFLRSDATYDVVHVWCDRIFLLDEHLNRFYESTKKLRMPCSHSKKYLKIILANCVKKSGLKNAYVEIIQTRGMSPTFDRDPRKAIPKLMAFAIPFSWILKQEDFEKGLGVVVTNIKRIPPTSVDPTIKNYHWLDLVSGMFEAYDRGHEVGILVDNNGNILEGPGFNIFSLHEDGLYTPENGVLKGVTRSFVLKIAKELKIPVKLSKISQKKFKSSLEIFVTSTAGGIMPVCSVNGKNIIDGKVGKITRKINKIYWDKHFDSRFSESVEDILL